MANVASAAHHVEVAVIGAGVIGLAVARVLAQAGKEVILLERASTIGSGACTTPIAFFLQRTMRHNLIILIDYPKSETSSRNSEVIHAGLYYPPSSFKGRFCVRGKEMLYEYCRSRHVPHQRCGKIIVATQETQWSQDLPRLRDQAQANGVLDVEIYSREKVQALEPQVECLGGLYSPSTGVLDSHSFMVSLLADAEDDGANLALNSKVESGSVGPDGIELNVGDFSLVCDAVVNSAGLWADQVARRIHANTTWQPPKQYFCKGNYFHLQGVKTPFRHLVYPLPEAAGGLGVHATIDWSGQAVKFGPDVEWLDQDASPDTIDLTTNPARLESFYDAVRKYWPDLPDDALVPDYAGIRPKLHHPSVSQTGTPADFMIMDSDEHGVPGLIHLLGMESPGLTSSMAVAEYVGQRLREL